MTQINPYGTADDPQRRILYQHNGIEFIKVLGRIIDPYTPPTPQLDLKEHKIIDGPSHLHQTGPSSYKCSITLFFKSRESYHEYLRYVDNMHKFIDERGNLYMGAVAGLKSSIHEAKAKYKLELEFIFEKKNGWETEREILFQDIEGLSGEKHILEMAKLGLIGGNDVLYFSPLDFITRAEATAILNNTRKWVERVVRK